MTVNECPLAAILRLPVKHAVAGNAQLSCNCAALKAEGRKKPQTEAAAVEMPAQRRAL